MAVFRFRSSRATKRTLWTLVVPDRYFEIVRERPRVGAPAGARGHSTRPKQAYEVAPHMNLGGTNL